MPLLRHSLGVFLLSAAITSHIKVIAQNDTANYSISGKVVDTSKKPLDKIAIQLLSDSNTTVKTVFTKMNGSFVFSGLSPLKYSIQITALGYVNKVIAVDVVRSTPNTRDLGEIYLVSKMNELQKVVVTTRAPLIKQEIDRITYDLQADPESKGNSVLTMMRKVPFLSLDADENILLNGSSGYKILINGKPSGMVERNPKEILRSMPASTIKSIEVITNPSSKYDAEGLAGIINIITNKKIDNGYNGTVNLSHRFPVGGPGAGGSFAFKENKLGVAAFGGTSVYNSPFTSSSINRITNGMNATGLQQNSSRNSDSRNAYFGSEVSYEIDSLQLISAQFNINGSRTNGVIHQHSLLHADTLVLQQYDLANSNHSNGSGMDAALNYQLGFKSSKDRLLTFSYRYMRYDNDQFNNLEISHPINYSDPDYNQFNEGISIEQTLQLDYVQKLKKVNMEAGIKEIVRNNKSDFKYQWYNAASGKFEVDQSRTNLFNNTQHIFAAYNTYQFALKNWGFKAGMRVEQTVVGADFISVGTQVHQNYFSLIPAATISRKFTNLSSLTLAYTNRIQRPGIDQLNPFVDRSNPDFEKSGNPNLKPAFTNIIQLSYNRSKKANINIAIGYMLSINAIGPLAVYDAPSKITRTSYENIGRARVVKTNIYLNYPITKNWNASLNSDVRYAKVGLLVKGVEVRNEGFVEYVSLTTGYRFTKGWRVNGDLTLKSGGVSSLQGKSNGFTNSTFGMQKDFLKSKFTCSVSVNNPFTKFRQNHEEVVQQDFTQVSDSQLYYRSFNLSVNYRFGKLKEAIKKNKRGINNDDVAN